MHPTGLIQMNKFQRPRTFVNTTLVHSECDVKMEDSNKIFDPVPMLFVEHHDTFMNSIRLQTK